MRKLDQDVPATVAERTDAIAFHELEQTLVDTHITTGEDAEGNVALVENGLELGNGKANCRRGVTAFIAAKLVRRGADGCDSVANERSAERDGFVHCLRTIVEAGQAVAVKVDGFFDLKTSQPIFLGGDQRMLLKL
jgi:hypothetical protein